MDALTFEGRQEGSAPDASDLDIAANDKADELAVLAAQLASDILPNPVSTNIIYCSARALALTVLQTAHAQLHCVLTGRL